MKHTPFVYLFLIFCMLSTSLHSQNLKEKISDNFTLLSKYPQEKLYLHLDKPYYAAGERIYWKGYLINAISHIPYTGSNFIYIELVSSDDRIQNRYKIKRKNGSFYGSITLPPDIPAGEYYLRAYTQWMMNAGDAYFYYHKLRIGNSLDRSIQSSIHYEEGEGQCTVTVRFTDEQNKPLPDVRVENRIISARKTEKHYLRRTNANGEIGFNIPLIGDMGDSRTIEVTFADGPYQYDRTFHVPLLGNRKQEFALSFFPEGGDLLDGCNQRVAFKAQQPDGNCCDLQGYLLNDSGDTISTVQTEHDGMGVFSFTPSAGEKYQVTASRNGSFYRRFSLPEVKSGGIQLSVYHRKGTVRYNLLKARHTQWQDTLYLVGHTRGIPNVFIPLTAKKTFGQFNDSELQEGITELLLVDNSGTVLSRRLIFEAPEELVNFEMPSLPPLAQRRKLVELPLCITDKKGNPVETSLSVSLTDRNVITPDSLTDHIRASFLLMSDLKGYINNPGYYFSERALRTGYHMELLLLTHGWSRFSHTDISQLPTVRIDYLMETKQVIGGKVTKLFGGVAKDCPVVLFAPKLKLTSVTNTDEKGCFAFEDIDYSDMVTFVAQAKSKAGRATVTLKIDSITYTQPAHPFPVTSENEKKFDGYDQIVRDIHQNEEGMQVVRLREVTVTASERQRAYRSYAEFSDSQYSGKLLEQLKQSVGSGSAFDLLGRLPRTQIVGYDLNIFGCKSSPVFLIDEMQCVSEEGAMILTNIDASAVENIELLRPESATLHFGSEAIGGAVVVVLKPGTRLGGSSPGLSLFTKQGYYESAEFYHPVYETSEPKENDKPDIRTTVYWNPNLQTDENGRAVIRFYTPDNLIDPHLIIEGVTANGYLLRVEE